jgi:cysteinyl-tRNA synthetase
LRTQAAQGAKGAAACLKASAQAIGLLQHSAAGWSAWRPQSLAIDEERIAGFIAARNAARKGKNFKEADRIRDELATMGIVLKDSKDGTTWEVAR